MNNKIFLSVGKPATEKQEHFVSALEDRLRREDLIPQTVGRNAYSVDSPLKAITNLFNECRGTVILALERTYFPTGKANRGGKNESSVSDVKLATPWNQIEATMAYCKGHPILVIVEKGLKTEGMLEHGYDWYVQMVEVDPSALETKEFNGVLSDWKNKLNQGELTKSTLPKNTAEMTIGELLTSLKPGQLWAFLCGIAILVSGAFALGGKLFG